MMSLFVHCRNPVFFTFDYLDVSMTMAIQMLVSCNFLHFQLSRTIFAIHLLVEFLAFGEGLKHNWWRLNKVFPFAVMKTIYLQFTMYCHLVNFLTCSFIFQKTQKGQAILTFVLYCRQLHKERKQTNKGQTFRTGFLSHVGEKGREKEWKRKRKVNHLMS